MGYKLGDIIAAAKEFAVRFAISGTRSLVEQKREVTKLEDFLIDTATATTTFSMRRNHEQGKKYQEALELERAFPKDKKSAHFLEQ